MSADIALSVLIPNYNYGRYIGETINSVLAQAPADIEVVVTDNASTDDSVDVVRRFTDTRVRLSVNPCNVGFAANLERVAALANGRRMLLLSSDDRMKPEALAAYRKLEEALGADAESAVWGAETTVIDSAGAPIGHIPPDKKLWRDAVVEPRLSAVVGYPVRSMPASAMLRRSLEMLRSPLPFASTCYSRRLHDQVGGYSGGRLMNPDKWFLWKLLAVADTVYSIDHSLFEYRSHGGGQNSIEQKSGALKHLTDQYVSTFNLPDDVLAKARLTREDLARAFIEHDIVLRGMVSIAEGRRVTAERAVHFALAAYPQLARSNLKLWMMRALLKLGPAATSIARLVRTKAEKTWQARHSRPTSET